MNPYASTVLFQLSVKVLTGGLTNKLFLCEYTPNEQKFLCRIYGEKTEQFIDRDAEIRNMHFLHSNGMGPRVHCTFRNGLCYDYFNGEVNFESVYIEIPRVASSLLSMTRLNRLLLIS